jgi:hypothetical protein
VLLKHTRNGICYFTHYFAVNGVSQYGTKKQEKENWERLTHPTQHPDRNVSRSIALATLPFLHIHSFVLKSINCSSCVEFNSPIFRFHQLFVNSPQAPIPVCKTAGTWSNQQKTLPNSLIIHITIETLDGNIAV